MDPLLNKVFSAQLSDIEFSRLSDFIYKESGIKMPPIKRIMLQSRLQKRLRELKMLSFKEYCDYVFSKSGQIGEIVHMLDVVSTNKTDFFREPVHFDFLQEVVLPEFYGQNTAHRQMKVWSAGCSSGEEPYTISIVMTDFAEEHTGFDFSILGTDLSTQILQKANNAVYNFDRVEAIPMEIKKRHFLKSKDQERPTVKLAPHIRKRVRFSRLNFMDNNYDISDMFDVVFCRNVLIYFDRITQEQVINKLCTKLKPGGYFFLGHSESIMSMNVPLVQVKPTIFKRI
ncbi:MAG TPA: CheR family methyltransferase [Williamwhitmania sp.]|nr:CheR family methyltransferase [Williamwhitmania sp.]